MLVSNEPYFSYRCYIVRRISILLFVLFFSSLFVSFFFVFFFFLHALRVVP